MSVEPYPNDEDLQALTEAQELLATAGIAPRPSGYDIDTLAAAIYRHGWSYRIDRAAGLLGYRAELRPQGGAALRPMVTAVGWEPEVAVALALARVLSQRAQGAAASVGAQREAGEAIGTR